MKTYQGRDNHHVTVDNQTLDPRNHIVNHSPSGFSWGYFGSGPSQLALAIMCEEYGEDLVQHPIHYQDLKSALIAKIRNPSFFITSDTVLGAVTYIQGKNND